jgi:AraC-like DNA-binding protein
MSELVINFGKPYQRIPGNSNEIITVKGSHFIGIKSKSCFVNPNNEVECVSIRFKPGASSFFNMIPSNELADDVISAVDIFGMDIIQLENRIGESKKKEEIIKLIEAFLIKRIKNNNFALETIDKVHSIYKNPTSTKLEYLENKNSNYKKNERRFLQYVGLPPKLFMKIVQFNYSTKIKSENPKISLTQIAHQSGYYDQAHFIKNFKQLTEITPKEYNPNTSVMTFLDQITINNQFELLK